MCPFATLVGVGWLVSRGGGARRLPPRFMLATWIAAGVFALAWLVYFGVSRTPGTRIAAEVLSVLAAIVPLFFLRRSRPSRFSSLARFERPRVPAAACPVGFGRNDAERPTRVADRGVA